MLHMTSCYVTATTAQLRADGFSRSAIASAVRASAIIRARRGVYLPGDTPDVIVRSVRVGGRLTCLSLLALLGVFVTSNSKLHVHMQRSASRMRSPHDRHKPLESPPSRGVRLHWLRTSEVPHQNSTTVEIVDALTHSVLCQGPRAAIATLDSALHLGLITLPQLALVFACLPGKYLVLRPLVDGRAESGPETLMRLMLRSLGCSVELQVTIAGVGRVDLVVDGWLVIECDSKAFHSGWEKQQADRTRDQLLAAQGYTPLRATADDILHNPEQVLAAVKGLLGAHG